MANNHSIAILSSYLVVSYIFHKYTIFESRYIDLKMCLKFIHEVIKVYSPSVNVWTTWCMQILHLTKIPETGNIQAIVKLTLNWINDKYLLVWHWPYMSFSNEKLTVVMQYTYKFIRSFNCILWEFAHTQQNKNLKI